MYRRRFIEHDYKIRMTWDEPVRPRRRWLRWSVGGLLALSMAAALLWWVRVPQSPRPTTAEPASEKVQISVTLPKKPQPAPSPQPLPGAAYPGAVTSPGGASGPGGTGPEIPALPAAPPLAAAPKAAPIAMPPPVVMGVESPTAAVPLPPAALATTTGTTSGAPPALSTRPSASGHQPPPPAPEGEGDWRAVTVGSGDNLWLIFNRAGLGTKTLNTMLALGDPAATLRQLRPGQKLRFLVKDEVILEMVHEIDLMTSIHLRRQRDGRYLQEKLIVQPETKRMAAETIIENSLFADGQKAGLSDPTILQLAQIFGWDIDFVLDLRPGDRFAVVYEQYLKDGVKLKDGPILAAEFQNQGRRFRSIRYLDQAGNATYYNDMGRIMNKSFLRTPVNFTRISSKFNTGGRAHPILHTIRAHKGVDYAAPHGTPVKTTGNGKVSFLGVKSGYGNTLIIDHGAEYSNNGDRYTTLYAHLSRFAAGLKENGAVRQGQTIAYVGQTGLATGPHLHYEFRLNGEHKDPLTVKLPTTSTVSKVQLADFQRKAAPLIAELERLTHRWTGKRVPSAAPQIQPQGGAKGDKPGKHT